MTSEGLPRSRSHVTISRSSPTLETLAPELLDNVLKYLLEDAKEVQYLGPGRWFNWSDSSVLDFFHLSRISARLRSHFWPAFLAQTTFVLRGWTLYSSAQLKALLSLAPDPERSIKKVGFWTTKFYIDVEVGNNELKECTVHFRHQNGGPHRANEAASQHLQIAIIKHALKDGRINWPLVLQLTCRIIPLVDTSFRPEEGIICPNGEVVYPANRYLAVIGQGPKIPLEESVKSFKRELDNYGIEKSKHSLQCVGDCFQDYMEQSRVETLLVSAQFLQRVGVEGSEHFPDLRGEKVLEYNTETRRKSLIALCRQLSQPRLAEILEAEAKEADEKSA